MSDRATPAVSATSAKRDHLVATALELFTAHGYHAVGIDTVLAQAKVAKGTLYNHFESKEDLIEAALSRKAEESRRSIEKVLSAAGEDPAERLLALFDWQESWFRSTGFREESWFRSTGFRGCLYVKAAGEYPNKKDKPHQAAKAFKQARLALLEELCGELAVKDSALLARQIGLLMEGAIVLAFIESRPEAARDAKAAAATLIAAAQAVGGRKKG
jgi:AcrR family transcriptional regulator